MTHVFELPVASVLKTLGIRLPLLEGQAGPSPISAMEFNETALPSRPSVCIENVLYSKARTVETTVVALISFLAGEWRDPCQLQQQAPYEKRSVGHRPEASGASPHKVVDVHFKKMEALRDQNPPKKIQSFDGLAELVSESA